MAAASSRFRSVLEEDFDSLLVEAVPEKTKVATNYGMKIFHDKNRSRKMTLMKLFFPRTSLTENCSLFGTDNGCGIYYNIIDSAFGLINIVHH